MREEARMPRPERRRQLFASKSLWTRIISGEARKDKNDENEEETLSFRTATPSKIGCKKKEFVLFSLKLAFFHTYAIVVV